MDEESGKIRAGEEKSARNHFAARGGPPRSVIRRSLLQPGVDLTPTRMPLATA